VQVYSAEQTAAIKNVVHELTNQLIISPFGNYLIQGWQIKIKKIISIFFILLPTVFKSETYTDTGPSLG
jgi:hypothetical protein